MYSDLYKSTASSKAADVQELFIDIKRILLATDGSTSAKGATKYAIQWAKRFGATVKAVFVDSDNDVTYLHRKSLQEYIDSSDSGIDGYDGLIFASKYAQENSVNVESVVILGNAARQIAEYAKVYSPDLIVLGNSERSGIRRSLGSVVDEVMKATEVPVLVVSDN